jgi:hypothetical protein
VSAEEEHGLLTVPSLYRGQDGVVLLNRLRHEYVIPHEGIFVT